MSPHPKPEIRDASSCSWYFHGPMWLFQLVFLVRACTSRYCCCCLQLPNLLVGAKAWLCHPSHLDAYTDPKPARRDTPAAGLFMVLSWTPVALSTSFSRTNTYRTTAAAACWRQPVGQYDRRLAKGMRGAESGCQPAAREAPLVIHDRLVQAKRPKSCKPRMPLAISPRMSVGARLSTQPSHGYCIAYSSPFVEVIDLCILLYDCGRSYSKTTCCCQLICCPVHKQWLTTPPRSFLLIVAINEERSPPLSPFTSEGCSPIAMGWSYSSAGMTSRQGLRVCPNRIENRK